MGQADQPLGLENPLATIWGDPDSGDTPNGGLSVYIYTHKNIYICIYMMYIHIHILKMLIFKRNTISLTSGRNLGSQHMYGPTANVVPKSVDPYFRA